MNTHPCPGGCGAQIPARHLACPADWFRLPTVMRTEVTAAYRGRGRDPFRHVQAVSAVSRWYRGNPRESS